MGLATDGVGNQVLYRGYIPVFLVIFLAYIFFSKMQKVYIYHAAFSHRDHGSIIDDVTWFESIRTETESVL